jgi:hypothetical protein
MTIELKDILPKYGVPDPSIVGKLPKGGASLDFVGHADVTKMLIEIDPNWTWEPVAFDADGLPAYRVENGMAHMAGWLTIHGVRRLGIGSVMHNKPDLLKELASDFIRNASMRFGICLALWTKQEWHDIDAPAPSAAPRKNASKPITNKTIGNRPQDAKPDETAGPETKLTKTQLSQFVQACVKAGLDADDVAAEAEVELMQATVADLDKLRAVFKSKVGK